MSEVLAGLGLLCALLLALTGALLLRTWLAAPPPVQSLPQTIEFDGGVAVEHLAQALRFPTVSRQHAEETSTSPFEAFHAWLGEAYPKFHSATTRRVFGLSLLYRWPGLDPELPPVLLMAHQDVVPVAPGTEGDWEYPPFSGTVEGGFVWGRGAIDMKSSLVGALEAAEALLAEGYRPRRSILFAFGHDEEVGGSGNGAIAEQLAREGVRLRWVLDEGLVVAQGLVPGALRPIALVGVAEKGFATLELTVASKGGHASMPPPSTAVGILSRAVCRIEKDPFPSRLDGIAAAMVAEMAPAMTLGRRIVFSNLWLLGPLVRASLEKSPSTNAVLRTTAAATVFRAGDLPNVLPQDAWAAVNVRIHPRNTLRSVIDRLERIVDDARVTVRVSPGSPRADPSPVSPSDGPGFLAVRSAIRAAMPEAVVAPGLSVAGTDSRHYVDLADAVYRFMPARLAPGDPERIHGTNERISVENFLQCVRFYAQLMREAGGSAAPL